MRSLSLSATPSAARKFVVGCLSAWSTAFFLAGATAEPKPSANRPAPPPSHDWPMFKYDLKRTGYTPSPAPDSAALAWETKVRGAGKFWSSPCVVAGRVYLGSANGNLYCFDAANGNPIWTFASGRAQPIFSSPAVAEELVFFAGYEVIYALPARDPSADGTITADEIKWSFRVGKSTGGVNNVVAGSPAMRGGKLFLGAVDQYFYCLPASTGGEPIWKTYTPYRGQHAFSSSPAIDGERIFAATGDQRGAGRLYCFAEGSGKILWDFDLDDITFSSPVIESNRVFIANSGDWIGGNRQYRLYCLDVQGYLDRVDDGLADDHRGNADLVWSFDTTDYVYSSPSIHQGRLYFGGANGTLTCVDAATGKQVWTYTSEARKRFTQPRGILSSPAIADGKLFCNVEGKLIVLPLADPNGDGRMAPEEIVWSYPIGGDGVCSPVIAQGRVYVGNSLGTLFCLGPSAGD